MDSFAPRDQLTEQIIGLAITAHRELGPGLLELSYEECLCYELKDNRIDFARQVPLAVNYKGVASIAATGWTSSSLTSPLLEIKAVDRLIRSMMHRYKLICG